MGGALPPLGHAVIPRGRGSLLQHKVHSRQLHCSCTGHIVSTAAEGCRCVPPWLFVVHIKCILFQAVALWYLECFLAVVVLECCAWQSDKSNQTTQSSVTGLCHCV